MPAIDRDLALGVFTASQWIIRLVALVRIPRRRAPEAARGWLLLFFVLPWLALLIYLAIGRTRHPRWRRRRVERLPAILASVAGPAERSVAAYVATPTERQQPIMALGGAIGGQPALNRNHIELSDGYDETITRMAHDIDGARRHVHLLFYIFADDATGDIIMRALERAARRGVRCRVLIDAVGSAEGVREVSRRLVLAGVEVGVALPLRFVGRFTRVDFRNHRKIAVVDGRVGWTGSQNVVDAQGGAPLPNREMMVRLEGPIVGSLQAVFVADWILETGRTVGDDALFALNLPATPDAPGMTAQVVASGPDRPSARIDLLFAQLIASANRRIVIASPYFIPSEPVLFALAAAAMRGVDVLLLLSGQSDSRLVALAQEARYGELIDAGITIHLTQPCFLHAKHLSVDGEVAAIGSANMDMRSSELNSEVTLVVYDSEVVGALERIEADCRAESRLYSAEDWRRRGAIRASLGDVARLFSPLL